MAGYEFPASSAQRRMWLLARLDPDQPTYNIAWAIRVSGPLDVDVLRRAWTAALARHESLRTTFRDESGFPVQVVEDDAVPEPLEVTTAEDPRRSIDYLARTRFDLATGPLLRARLLRLAPERHVLAVVAHHIVADGWSFRLLFDELSADYEAIQLCGAPAVGEPPIQYADFAIWQEEHAEDGGYARSERFWRTELADAPTTLALPTDAPYPARQTFAAGAVTAAVDEPLAAALRDFATDSGITLFAVLLAAYAIVLARLTGGDDLLIAVPMAARTRPETGPVVGLFMNTVPLRVRVDRAGSLGELARSVHAATARALDHQELPFARIVELVRPQRDPARLPLTQVMFSMEESWSIPERGGLCWTPELVHNGNAKFELELAVTDAPTGPRLRVAYNSALFERETAFLVAGGFVAALRAVAENPTRPVREVEIMPADDIELVTRTWPQVGPAADPDTTALALLWSACAGETVVAQGSDGTLTGAEVRTLAATIATALRGQGVGRGDRVAILLPRGARLLPAILGVWLAGAAYVPLDAIYPERRQTIMLGDAGARAILIDSSVPGAPHPPPGATPLAVVDLAALPDSVGVLEVPRLPPAAAGYTIFTSGSTGRPKAVTVTQGGVAALLAGLRSCLAIGPGDVLVAIATVTFDIAVVELLAPVLGARVVVADAECARDGVLLRELLVSSGATAVQATPAGWRMLLEAGGVPSGVRLRISTGEALPRDLADALGGPGIRLYNLYGPTETTVFAGGAVVEPSPAPIEIGPLLPGTALHVLDADLRPVPPGVMGEVYVGGAGVATGYPAAPGLTASRFVPDPLGGRLYRTGDLGRWRRSGRIELAGRADRQLKIRGYRVESGEIEAALREHRDVAEAVVALRGGGADVRLVAYLVTRTGAPPPDLAERLGAVLPPYLVPAAFVALPRLPLTASGKVDHRALPEPDWAALPGREPVAPRTPVESELAAIVAELLALPAPVGVTDNFFALGGHSLTAARLMSRVRAAYGVDLPLRVLFADPTVAGVAAALAGAGR